MLLVLLISCGEKNAEPAPPPVGWHAEELWSGQCYYPPDFDAVEAQEGIAGRRLKRQATLEAMMSQWKGERDDGVSFPPNVYDDVETTLFGRPEQIEVVALKNLDFCKQVMGAGASTDAWHTWLRKLPDQLTAGECLAPLVNTYFNYLDIGMSWQFAVPVCADDVVEISGTNADKYRIKEGGPWINVEGVPGSESPTGEEWPCQLESCREGMLIARFVSDSGIEEVFPVGLQTTFRAPNHGTITVTINDTTYYDNVYFKSGGIVDHTGITIAPAN